MLHRYDNSDKIPDCSKFKLFQKIVNREECLTGPSVNIHGSIVEDRIKWIYNGTNLDGKLDEIIDVAHNCENEANIFMDKYEENIVKKWKEGQRAP